MSGSGGDRGYDYQADAYAYLASHGLAGQPLGWFDDVDDTPSAILMETGGPGDDLRFTTLTGIEVEVQAKHGLRAGQEFHAAVMRLLNGLRDNPASRAVLLVDHHASQTIRDSFKHDAKRFGQGRSDGLCDEFRSTLDALRPAGLAEAELFQRFCVAVVDLDDASDGQAAARALLGTVVSRSHSGAAFRLLGKQGHGLTKGEGRQTVDRIARYLSLEIGLASSGNTPAVLWNRYRTWLETTTGTFYCTALGKQFPIGQAWNRLRVLVTETSASRSGGIERLAKEIERYHEWQRLARESTRTDAVEAEDFLFSHHRCVILGGPGAGKSTLGVRLVNWLASRGHSAFRVRLPTVRGLLLRGSTLDQAIALAALEGTDFADERARSLGAPQWLIADGLDECDPERTDLAVRLKNWADGHPECGLCILSRPVGHVPDMLPGFDHAELVPLDSAAVRERSNWFFDAISSDSATTAAHAFFEELGRSDVATLASRNPLLLGFLVRLSVDGQAIGVARTELFKKVIECICKAAPTQRRAVDVEHTVAHRAINVIGWSVLTRPTRAVDEVRTLVAESLGGGLAGQQLAAKAVTHWEQNGLVERIVVGTLDAITFIHPALGEYAAGRYLAELPADSLGRVITEHRRSPRWRAPLVFAASSGAANTVVCTLLGLDDPCDPASSEASLAAEAASEGNVDMKLLQAIVDHLCDRLTSPVPIVAVDAGLALARMGSALPGSVTSRLQPLWNHQQAWTRLAAFSVGLLADRNGVSMEQVRKWVEGFQAIYGASILGVGDNTESGMPSEAAELQNLAMPLAISRLARELPEIDAKAVTQSLLRNGNLSLHTTGLVGDALRQAGHREWYEEIEKDTWGKATDEFIESFERAGVKSREAGRFLLECIAQTAASDGSEHTSVPSGRYVLLGMLMDAMEFFELPVTQWYSLARRFRPDIVGEVVRGAAVASGIDMANLGCEVNSLLNTLGDEDRLYLLVSRIPVTPQWSRTSKTNLDRKKLVEALSYPCGAVSVTAAQLLAVSDLSSVTPELEDVLQNGSGFSLQLVGALSKDAWGEDAFPLLHRRLKGSLTNGCDYLYKWLLEATVPEQLGMAWECVLRGMLAPNPEIAEAAAQQLSKFSDSVLREQGADLRQVLIHWEETGSWCDRCRLAVTGGSCSKCSTVPKDPRSEVIGAMARSHQLTLDELLGLSRHARHNVRDEATKAVASMAARSPETMANLVLHFNQGTVDAPMLNAVLALPVAVLRGYENSLLQLAQSPTAWVRARVISALSAGWTSHEVAQEVARAALNDPVPVVRNSATRSLRTITEQRSS